MVLHGLHLAPHYNFMCVYGELRYYKKRRRLRFYTARIGPPRMDVWRSSVYNIQQDSKLYMIVLVRPDPFVLNISQYTICLAGWTFFYFD